MMCSCVILLINAIITGLNLFQSAGPGLWIHRNSEQADVKMLIRLKKKPLAFATEKLVLSRRHFYINQLQNK